jgi:hypothetical protein
VRYGGSLERNSTEGDGGVYPNNFSGFTAYPVSGQSERLFSLERGVIRSQLGHGGSRNLKGGDSYEL